MRCPICLEAIVDIGNGYQCKKCGYFLEYVELEECEDEIYMSEGYIEYKIKDRKMDNKQINKVQN